MQNQGYGHFYVEQIRICEDTDVNVENFIDTFPRYFSQNIIHGPTTIVKIIKTK